MKKRIINILLFLLKKLGYKENIFKPTTVVEMSCFKRLDFKVREDLSILRTSFPEQCRPYALRHKIIEEVGTALLNEIRVVPLDSDFHCSIYEAQLTIYIRKNK